MFLLDPRQIGRKATDPEALGETVSPPSTGRYYFTGKNTGSYGLIGNSTDSATPIHSSPTQLGSETDYQQIDGNNYGTHSIRNSSRLYGWGYNGYGMTGNGTYSAGGGTDYESPVQIGALTDWQHIAHTRFCTFGIRGSGLGWTWGQNNYGATGQPSHKSSPTALSPTGGWTVCAAGGDNMCGITGGKFYAWGSNGYGMIPNGTTSNQTTPLQIGVATDWTKITSDGYSGAAIRGGDLYCWGYNGNGNHGQGDTTHRSSPVQVTSPSGKTWVEVAGGDPCLALTNTGELWVCGGGYANGIGTGSNISTFQQIGAETYWESITSYANGFAARRTDGKVYIWGPGEFGRTFGASGNLSAVQSPMVMGGVDGSFTTTIGLKGHNQHGQSYTGTLIY